jgi:hypothetical protein
LDIYDISFKKSLFSGIVFGLSYLIQYASFGLLFFLAAIFVADYNVAIEDVMGAIFLTILGGISAGNNFNFI